MTDNALKTQAFKLKGRLFTFTVLQLLETDIDFIEHQLDEVVTLAPKLFDKTPIVIDCSGIDTEQFDLSRFCQAMRMRGIFPVAVQGGNARFETFAQVQGLAVLHSSSNQDKPLLMEHALEMAPKNTAEPVRTKLLTTPVRSGQQVVSKGGDLVIAAAVSHGAELLADGNIHVYGALRGRALAGIAGDKQARIFCQSLDAELVSIAGYYCLSDIMRPINGPCQIFLQDDRIQIEPL